MVLVGGSTRMPCVPRLLRAVFPGRDVTRTVNPDEAVAHGAALLAAHHSKELRNSALDGILVCDVTPLSVGVGEEDGAYRILIPRNTPLPVRRSRTFETVYRNQEHYALSVGASPCAGRLCQFIPRPGPRLSRGSGGALCVQPTRLSCIRWNTQTLTSAVGHVDFFWHSTLSKPYKSNCL